MPTEKEEFEKKLDKKNKLDIITMNIEWKLKDDNTCCTTFKFDERLLNKKTIPKEMENSDYEFCRAIWGSLQFDTKEDIKENMLKYVKEFFNSDINDIHIFSSGHLGEPYTCIISDANDKQMTWIKFLHQEITDEVWQNYQKSRAGKESVIME